MQKYKIKSFSKINLSLRVIKKLKNNYHAIKSFITFCDLHDVILIQKINCSKDKISFSGKFKNGINKKKNTITKVLQLLRKRRLLKREKFHIKVQKNIPLGSGLGGGSSNAASLLNFFNKKLSGKLSKDKMQQIAKKIGFDVPINLERKNTLLIGQNDKMLRTNKKFKLNILLVYPNIICSTKKIYKKNDKFTLLDSKFKFITKNRKKLNTYLKSESNDQESTVIKFYPKIQKIINFIQEQKGCYFSRITGSGSVCIGIFSSMKLAIYAQKLIKQKFPKYWSTVSKTI